MTSMERRVFPARLRRAPVFPLTSAFVFPYPKPSPLRVSASFTTFRLPPDPSSSRAAPGWTAVFWLAELSAATPSAPEFATRSTPSMTFVTPA